MPTKIIKKSRGNIFNDNYCQLNLSINVNSEGSYFIMLDAHCFASMIAVCYSALKASFTAE